MQEFFQVIPLSEGQELVAAVIPPVVETVGLLQAVHRVLARPVVSGEDLPGFARSSVDGYALMAADTFGASEAVPAYLTLKGRVTMGEAPRVEVGREQCVYIPTGGMLPPGADAVVMLEHTELLGEDMVLVNRPAAPGENVIQKGEDARAGETIYPAGHYLRPQDVGVLAALGVTGVEVRARVRTGIVSSGDEIVPPQQTPGPGQVRDVNSYALLAAVTARGGLPSFYGVVPDHAGQLTETLRQALEENDLILLSGGSSVGFKDMSLQAMLAMPDAELLFHGLAVKPGKPTLAVRTRNQLIIGLPGHPVSAYMIFELLVAPLLGTESRPRVFATLTDNLPSAAGRDDFVRVRLTRENEGYLATPVWGKSGLMRIMTRAEGYVHIPAPAQGILKGQQVPVWLFD